jgi:hypothetical protein
VLRRLAPLVACIALAACGGSGDDEDEVRKVVNQLYAGLADRKANRVCDTLSRRQHEAITAGADGKRAQSCEQVMSLVLSLGGAGLKQAKQAEVTDVELDGDQATVTVEYRNKKTRHGLAKENGAWKIDGLNLDSL